MELEPLTLAAATAAALSNTPEPAASDGSAFAEPPGDPAPAASLDEPQPAGAPGEPTSAAPQGEPGLAGLPSGLTRAAPPGGPTPAAPTAPPNGPAPPAAAPPGEPAAAAPPDALSPGFLYIVSDGLGFVGAFLSAGAVEEAVVRAYPTVPCLVQKFPVAPGPCDRVWVVLYRDLDAVAFASNARCEAERVRDLYARVGLVYLDDLDCWEQPLGTVASHAAERLASRHRAHLFYAGPCVEEELQKMRDADMARAEAFFQPRDDGPLARAMRENERITIMDCVVPAVLEGVGLGVSGLNPTPGGAGSKGPTARAGPAEPEAPLPSRAPTMATAPCSGTSPSGAGS